MWELLDGPSTMDLENGQPCTNLKATNVSVFWEGAVVGVALPLLTNGSGVPILEAIL